MVEADLLRIRQNGITEKTRYRTNANSPVSEMFLKPGFLFLNVPKLTL
jgi:hypothetical protein